jgi:hypothetical protein
VFQISVRKLICFKRLPIASPELPDSLQGDVLQSRHCDIPHCRLDELVIHQQLVYEQWVQNWDLVLSVA